MPLCPTSNRYLKRRWRSALKGEIAREAALKNWESGPQRLKPERFCWSYGTSEVVP
jgi:hypothetical protein